MKKLFIILLIFSISEAPAQDRVVKLASMMDGKLQLENGDKIAIWGYGWDTLTPYVQLPAPLLEFEEGDSVNLRFRNISNEAHTIHLHGLDVSQVNDGVPTTSFYVWNGDTANYSFDADNVGVFLYHCHVTTTLHLTMGMYGMIIVNHPGNKLYSGGPGYVKQYPYLTSDLSKSLNPVDPPPFNAIIPDYFMINGRSGQQILDYEGGHIILDKNESAALRLGNMAYSKTRYIFPANLNVMVYMSDGRILDQPFSPDTLEVYSGERYSAIVNSDVAIDDFIEVQYYNTINQQYKGSNYIPVNIGLNAVFEKAKKSISISPNPSSDVIRILNSKNGIHKLFDSHSRLIQEFYISSDIDWIDINQVNSGLYLLVTPTGESLKLVKR